MKMDMPPWGARYQSRCQKCGGFIKAMGVGFLEKKVGF